MKIYARNLNLMGVICAASGNEVMAIDYYLEGLEYAIDYEFNDIILIFYNNIGSRYQELGEYEKAVSYYLKVEQELKSEAAKKQDKYESWCLGTYINLASAYLALEKYILSEEYIEKAKEWLTKDANCAYRLYFKCTEWRLNWAIGRKDEVKEDVNAILSEVMQDSYSTDYVESIQLICELMQKMKEFEKWKLVIVTFENFAKEQESTYYQLILTELWMEYYKAASQREKYIEYCVKHAELYQKQKAVANKERASAIDIKIALFQKEVERKKVEIRSYTDSLTGLGNRYKLDKDIKKVLKEACAKENVIAFGLLDIDCFKQENDTYGHIKGDECLVHVADILKKALDGRGGAYRFGGDEFILLIWDGAPENVTAIARKIKENLHLLKLENLNSTIIPEVTVSQGYASFLPKSNTTREEMLELADEALYIVKERGKNGYFILEK